VICLKKEWLVVQKVFKQAYAIEDSVTFLFPDGPVQLSSDESLAEKAHDPDLTISDHEYIPAYTVVGGISLQDWGCDVFKEVQLLTV
jgi:hypothetical protein